MTHLSPVAHSMQAKRGKLGETLLEWRKKRGWTLDQVCLELGVPYRTYQEWELGHRNPSAAARALLKAAMKGK